MASIDKLPSGNYRARIVTKDGKRKSFTAKTKSEVKRMVMEYEYCHDDSRDRTILECMERYMESHSKILSPSTMRSYSQAINRLGVIGEHSAKEITSEQLQVYVNELSMRLAPKTVRNTYNMISTAIRASYPNKVLRVSTPQLKPIERHIPTEEQVKRLISESSPELRKAILLASVGTMRRGEIAALTYGDIENDTIHVHGDIVQNEHGKWVYKDIPKTSKSDRFIEYPHQVIEQLGEGELDEKIVKMANPEMITQYFIALRNKLGLKCRFHDLRAYCASIMHAIGIPDEYVMQRGGWETDATLKAVYRNALDDQTKINTDKTNEYMKRLFE